MFLNGQSDQKLQSLLLRKENFKKKKMKDFKRVFRILPHGILSEKNEEVIRLRRPQIFNNEKVDRGENYETFLKQINETTKHVEFGRRSSLIFIRY